MRGARRRLARTPLWLRLVSATLLMVTLAITLTGLFAVQLLRGYLIERADQQLHAAGVLWRGRVAPPPPDPGPGHRFFGLFHGVLLDAGGTPIRTLSESTDAYRPDLPRLTAAEVARRHGRPFTVESIPADGPAWRVVAVPTRAGDTRVVAVNLGEVDATLSQLVLIVAVGGGGTLVVLGVACHWLVRRSLRPLREIALTARDIAGGDLSRRVPLWAGTTEIGKLGRALNGMLGRIELAVREREAAAEAARESAAAAQRSAELMRRFMADASHELRTPLTSIRGFAELYRLDEDGDPLQTATLMERIEGQATRMGLLVEDMLLLARLDQRRALDRDTVDILSLAATTVIDAQMLAPDRRIELVRRGGGDGPVLVTGDEPRLGQVLGNLVTNALTHTPPGTPFRVTVGVRGDRVEVEVADEGPGFPPGVAERVFERFYRADPARGAGGSGLGLAIAATLVEAHGGTITATGRPGGGAIFRVTLPAVPPGHEPSGHEQPGHAGTGAGGAGQPRA
ncbi:HAMP domain-containing sensor histidine kinase [Nonomuraea muscovyensis]|uniref:histidine kinase n=1 Tax=Nonomuraea muscovyensis TaxID=1124761 RepID=A0A7X0BWR5_9ACTN|nr:HAMP domain-containing sensor histidine kinase [Nonomuraea muscovyensis]MBB6343576.1 two-component system OmpR family sensor kinase [Nonomuraea muscovyensis]